MNQSRGIRLLMPCPHCRTRAKLRYARQDSPTLYVFRFMCDDIECGHSFEAQLEYGHTLSPSAIPNPEVCMPVRDKIARRHDFSRTT